MERGRSYVFTIAAALALALLAGAPVSAAEDRVKPRVINGVPYPPLSGAAIALETDEGFYCSGSLWRSRIVATAAHCLEDADGEMITADQVTLWAPEQIPPDPHRMSGLRASSWMKTG